MCTLWLFSFFLNMFQLIANKNIVKSTINNNHYLERQLSEAIIFDVCLIKYEISPVY